MCLDLAFSSDSGSCTFLEEKVLSFVTDADIITMFIYHMLTVFTMLTHCISFYALDAIYDFAIIKLTLM